MLLAKTHLMSLGYLCQQLQKSPAAIEAALDALGIAPEVKINGVAHYSEEAYFALAEQPKEIHGNA